MNKEELLIHYPKAEDKLLISKILDKIQFVKTKNCVQISDFLDMYQIKIITQVLNSIKYKNYRFYGGFDDAERKELVLYPEKMESIFNDNYYNYNNVISVVRINLSKEMYGQYTHRDYLGAMMKLGIKREKIGDIIVDFDGADIVISKDIEKFTLGNLVELKRFSKSDIYCVNVEEIRELKQEFQMFNIIVPSIRLDCVVGEILHISRTKALEIINQERVFVNFEVETRLSKILNEADMITVRGKGRFKLKSINGTTSKGRVRIEVEKFV